MPDAIKSMVVNGVTIEAVERGSGRPILFLHPGIGIDPAAPVLTELAKGKLTISVKDRHGNRARIERTVSTAPAAQKP